MTSNEIRQQFLQFFEEKRHKIVPSSPIVVKDDPTLLFTNAGMNPFKDIFLGTQKTPDTRVADTQKCLRVSGKHNDLDEVGHDTYHHTMFEMLGNWSFGDYFKAEAISFAWELLVERLGIDQGRLYATYFEGTSEVDTDEESQNLWLEKLPKERILKGNAKDNFWEMGITGPCGPCSEIHIDLRNEEERATVEGASLVNQDHPLVIEIWNLVFIQYNRQKSGELVDLPQKHVDTGMGFERLCCVLQNKVSTYDTDLFTPLIEAVELLCGQKYGANEKSDIAFRVIVDHIRAVSFAIADGQIPSNNKGGYVIRRILRRALRYGYSFLNLKEPFLYNLVEPFTQLMGGAFPELRSQEAFIKKVVREEELSFLRTLSTGIKLLEGIISETLKQGENSISGKRVFELYDTYGFPKDLTATILNEHHLTWDEASFENALQVQKERAQIDANQDTSDWVVIDPSTEHEFVGYDTLTAEVKILRYREVNTAKKKSYQLVLYPTPFYAEGGGQIGDKGYLENDGERIIIQDTIKENTLFIHVTDKLPHNLSGKWNAVVSGKRLDITANHSATHLIYEAMREVLGSHVQQKGSLVTADYLRFDFSHFQKITDEEWNTIQQKVNEKIALSIPLKEIRSIEKERALEMGAMALFDEKYGDTVRVIQFGSSIELCGGTHVSSTSQIGQVILTSQSAVSAGVRRIEAVSRGKALQLAIESYQALNNIKQLLKRQDITNALEELQQKNKQLEKQVEKLQKIEIQQTKKQLQECIEKQEGIALLVERVENVSSNQLKDVVFQLRKETKSLAICLATQQGAKTMLTVAFSDDLVNKNGLNATVIIKELARHIQGGGGGQPFYATAGGKKSEGITDAFATFKRLVVSS